MASPSPTSTDKRRAMAGKKTDGETNGQAPEKISKQEAVRRALATLGNEAKPLVIQAHVKKAFALDMTTDHVSTAKGEILKKARAGKKPGARQRRSKESGLSKTSPPQQEPALGEDENGNS